MALRSEKTASIVVLTVFFLTPALEAQREFEFPARHDHLFRSCSGMLRVSEEGIEYREEPRKPKKDPHVWTWSWENIQQLHLTPEKLQVLSYQDVRLKLGADRAFNFKALEDVRFSAAYPLLKDRLDQRFVAALADETVAPVWRLPVKHLGRISGTEGVFIVGEDRIVYQTDRAGESRTWRYMDIENVSSSGPFQLTLTTFERATLHYGNRKGFNFQLKQPLDEERYNNLWRRIHLAKGLNLLTSIHEREKTK